MRNRLLFFGVALWFGVVASASAQFAEGDSEGGGLGPSRVQRLRVGITVQAVGGTCNGIVGHTVIPIEWPEQQVKIVDEEITPNVRLRYVPLGKSAKMMEIKVSTLRAGDEAKAIVTFEIRRSSILPPDDTDVYVLPDSKKMGRDIRMFLRPSPKIESTDRKIRTLAREIGADQEKAWDRVEAICDWVRDTFEYKTGPIKGAIATLEDGVGDCEGMTSLFIAICRAADIPARTVWVDGHCYPEFYLVDAENQGHWFPCQAAGSRAFGGILELRTILSKGDNFRPPYNPREHQRYPAVHFIGSGGKPRVKFIRKEIPD